MSELAMSQLMRLAMKAGTTLLLAVTFCVVLVPIAGCADEDPYEALVAQGQANRGSTGANPTSGNAANPLPSSGDGLPGEVVEGEGVEELGYTGPKVLAQMVECVGMHPEFEEEGLYDIKIFFVADLPGNTLVIPEEYAKAYRLDPEDQEDTTDAMDEMLEGDETDTESDEDGQAAAESAEAEDTVKPEDLAAYHGHNVWEFIMYDGDGNVVATDMREAAIPTRIQSSMVWKNLYCTTKPKSVEIRLTEIETTTADDQGNAPEDGRENRGSGGRGEGTGGIGSGAS